MGVSYREQYKPEHLEPFFPNEIIKMIIVVLCTLALLMFLVVLPVFLEQLGIHGISHAEEPADPSSTPAHIRPEWYFLGVYQYLKLMPAEVLGISGKALGIFTQMIAVILLFLVPFWYPLRSAGVEKKDWRLGLLTFILHWLAFLLPVVGLLWLRGKMSPPSNDILHPMFFWPPLWVVTYIAVGLLMNRAGFGDAWKWLKLLSTGVMLVGFQGLVFLVVLGQGLSWIIDPALAYLVGGALFLAATIVILWFLVRRVAGADEHLRVKLMTGFATEGLLLFLSLTVWAMWPVEGLFVDQGAHSETRRFLFSVGLMVFALTILGAFLINELRVVHRTLDPEERDRLE